VVQSETRRGEKEHPSSSDLPLLRRSLLLLFLLLLLFIFGSILTLKRRSHPARSPLVHPHRKSSKNRGAGEDTDFLGLVVVVLEDGEARSGGTQSHGREREGEGGRGRR